MICVDLKPAAEMKSTQRPGGRRCYRCRV